MKNKPIIRHCINCKWAKNFGTEILPIIFCTVKHKFNYFTRAGALLCPFYKKKDKEAPQKIQLWNGQVSCPNCKSLLGNYNDILVMPARCMHCGQALDWGDGE